MVPGQRYDMRPPGFAMAHHLRAGHRLVLRITTSDPDKVPLFAVDPAITVFTGNDATALHLPGGCYPADVRYMLWSTDGFRPMVNGCSGFDPSAYAAL